MKPPLVEDKFRDQIIIILVDILEENKNKIFIERDEIRKRWFRVFPNHIESRTGKKKGRIQGVGSKGSKYIKRSLVDLDDMGIIQRIDKKHISVINVPGLMKLRESCIPYSEHS